MLAIYSDDLGVASPGYNKLIRHISSDLGSMLGFLFKSAKDVEDSSTMEFIGYEIVIVGGKVTVRAREKIRERLRQWLEQF